MNDRRYPYTYAADYIRSIVGYNMEGELSRSDASLIIQKIADAVGLSKDFIAERLADVELSKTEGDYLDQAKKLLGVKDDHSRN